MTGIIYETTERGEEILKKLKSAIEGAKEEGIELCEFAINSFDVNANSDIIVVCENCKHKKCQKNEG